MRTTGFLLLWLTLTYSVSAQSATTRSFDLTPTTKPAEPYYSRTVYQRYPDGYGPQPAPAYSTVNSDSQFSRGQVDFSIGGMGYTTHGDHGNDTLGFVIFDVDYFLLDTLSIGFEGGIAPGSDHHHHDYYYDDDGSDGVRAGEELAMLRWHFLTSGALSLYADGGVGGLQQSRGYPYYGHDDSFLGVVGLGVTWKIVDHIYVDIGARAAFLNGGGWDSSHHGDRWSDGAQYYGGFTFLFP